MNLVTRGPKKPPSTQLVDVVRFWGEEKSDVVAYRFTDGETLELSVTYAELGGGRFVGTVPTTLTARCVTFVTVLRAKSHRQPMVAPRADTPVHGIILSRPSGEIST